MNKLKMNKKGNVVVIILFFTVLFIILFLGFLMVTGSSILNWVWDEGSPILTDLGVIGDTNMTQVAEVTLTPVTSLVQSFTWLTGVLYVMMLIGSVGLAIAFKSNPSRWLLGFFFGCVIILVLGSMFMSNMYEDFYDGDDELATRLHEHMILSWLILYSPAVFTVISLLTGIILFSGIQEEEFV